MHRKKINPQQMNRGKIVRVKPPKHVIKNGRRLKLKWSN